jgi:co-chaperonin GroES (HSP10)
MTPKVTGKLVPIRDNVLITDMEFGEEQTKGGIVIPSMDGKSEGIKSRWGRVWAIGPNQKDVKVGEWILLEHGRWTRGTLIEDQESEKTIRRIDPADILLVSDDPQQDETIGQGL